MTGDTSTRRLATIVALDVAGYSARTEKDEAKTTAEIAALRKVVDGIAEAHGGRVFNTAGDGFMLEFGSSLAAVEAAIALANECEPKVRVGVHLGDVVVQANGDLLGHGVNVAARLMARSDPGSALVSGAVRHTIRGTVAERLVFRGVLKLDKMAETIEAFSTGGSVSSDVTSGKADPRPPGPVPPRSEAISIAVIPFQSMSDDPIDTSLARGLSVEIGNALSQVGSLRAVSSIAFAGTDREPDLRALGSEWKVQYAVTGSFRRLDAQYRVLAQLVSVTDGAQVWSATYDERDADLIEIEKLIAESIVRQIGGEVMRTEYARVHRSEASSADAWALTAHSAHMIIERRGGPKAWDEAIAIVEKAIAMAPDYGSAHARLSALCGERIIFLASPDPSADRLRAIAAAETAIDLAGHDPYTLMNAAQGLSLCADVERGHRLIKRALQALPHDLLAWLFYWNNAIVSQPQSEIPHRIAEMEETVRRHPTHPLAGLIHATVGLSHFLLGDLGKAKAIFMECFEDAPGFSYYGLLLATIHAMEGRVEEAHDTLAKIRERGFRCDRRSIEELGRLPSGEALAQVLLPILD